MPEKMNDESTKLRKALEELGQLGIPSYLYAMGCSPTAIKVEDIFKRVGIKSR